MPRPFPSTAPSGVMPPSALPVGGWRLSVASAPVERPVRHRSGVTLLELLIVLVLMGIGAALVAPMLKRPAVESDSAIGTVVARARQAAVRRAEPLRVRLGGNGAWTVTSQRSDVVIDSGRVSGAVVASAWDVDALGGCVPVASASPRAPFDGLDCGIPASAHLGTRGAP